jgi:2-alkenal reductase
MNKRITVVSSLVVIAALLVSCAPVTTQATTATPTVAATKATAVVNLTTVAEQDAFEKLYEVVNPSVVDVRVVENATSTTQDTQYSFPDIPGFPQFGTPQQQQNTAPTQVEGAGFIYDSAGHIVTNNHVVENASRIVVTFSDGTQVDAKLIGTDPGTDLAVIQVSGVDSSLIKPITLADSTQLKVGQLVAAIGSPFMLQGTMTTGIISALGRTMLNTNGSSSQTQSSTATTAYYSIPDMIQTDAAINHGNSGGPLVDINGQVVGVNTAIESTSDSNAGIGYAIPSAVIKMVATGLISTGKVEHTYLGINPAEMTPDLATAMNLPTNTRGILIQAASATGPAGKAGLKGSSKEATIDGVSTKVGGDIITSIDGQSLKTYNQLVSYLLLSTKAGQEVTLGIIRDGKATTVKVTLEARPASS